MSWWTIVYSKNNDIFASIKIWNCKKWTTIKFNIKRYLSGSAFLIKLTATNKQSFRVNSACKSSDHLSNSLTINKFTTLFEAKVILSCFKQLSLNFILILELFIHTSFVEILWFTVKGGLLFSFDSPLDYNSAILFGRSEKFVRVLWIGWNINKFCDPSLPNVRNFLNSFSIKIFLFLF